MDTDFKPKPRVKPGPENIFVQTRIMISSPELQKNVLHRDGLPTEYRATIEVTSGPTVQTLVSGNVNEDLHDLVSRFIDELVGL